MSKKINLSLSLLAWLGLTVTGSYADSVICIKADAFYRLNYIPGTPSTHIINPGEYLMNATSGDTVSTWSGTSIGNIPTVSAKEYVNIANNALSVEPLTGTCAAAPSPQPGPSADGYPALPSQFTITLAPDSADRHPSLGKEYAAIGYSMWYGYQSHYLDIYQDGQKICLVNLADMNSSASIPTDCAHSYTFSDYQSGSQSPQLASLEFGPTTTTRHQYRIVLTNDKGQSTQNNDINLSQTTGLTSVMTVTSDPASIGKTTADTLAEKKPNISLTAAHTPFTFNVSNSTNSSTQTLNQHYKLEWSNPELFTNAPTQTDNNGSFTVSVQSLTAGRSALRITDDQGNVRYIGFTIVDPKFAAHPMRLSARQRLNAALPPYIAMGSMTEDNSGAINYWRHFNSDNLDQNRRVDIRYIYLNQWSNGNEAGWASRETTFLQNGLELGQMPFFVEYNVNGGQDSQGHVKDNLQNADFMASYFSHLAQAAQIAHEQAGNTPVGFILEPDMLGYMLHDLKQPVSMYVALDKMYTLAAPVDVSTINVPYSQKQNLPQPQPLIDKNQYHFPNTLQGFVQAVNYVLWKYSHGTAVVGWQMNLWASPDNDSSGIIHKDRQTVIDNAQALAQQGQDLGIRPSTTTPQRWDNSFISIDKYGLDGAGYQPSDPDHPATSVWFWNAALYDNYLAFASSLAYPNRTGITNLPIILWQLPVGHLNGNRINSPYTGVPFKNLNDTPTQYEGSSAPYFLGEQFSVNAPGVLSRDSASGELTTCSVNQQKMPYFACPDNENGVDVSGLQVTWKSHMNEAADAHVAAILFGAGVGASTHGHPLTAASAVSNKTSDPDTYADTPDDNWFIYALQQYYKNPVSRQN